MDTLFEMLRSDFLLRDALVATLLVGVVCPLAGIWFVLRRMVFLGVALPQVSAAGIALSFFLYGTMVGSHEHFQLGEQVLAMIGSFTLTLIVTLVLAVLDRRRGAVEARIGTTYAIASAGTILLLAKDPHGEAQMVNLLKGDMLAVTATSLGHLASVLGVAALVLFAFRRELLLVSFDRDLAIVLGKRTAAWDLVLYLVIGAVISICVMTAGPIATFGFLIIPPVTIRPFVTRVVTFTLASAALGGFTAFAGFYCSYRFDFPLGPAAVGCASVILGIAGIAAAALRHLRGRVR